MTRILFFNTLLILMILVAAGCKKDDNPASSVGGAIPVEFVGTWIPQSATVNGTATPVATVLDFVQGAASARYVFNANGTFTYSELGGTGTVLYSNAGTFAVNGQTFAVSVATENGQPLNPPVSISGTWAIAGNQFVMTYQAGGKNLVVTMTK
jgi:hypothetical protein